MTTEPRTLRVRRERILTALACAAIVVLFVAIGYAVGRVVARTPTVAARVARTTAKQVTQVTIREQNDRQSFLAACARSNQRTAVNNNQTAKAYDEAIATYQAFKVNAELLGGLARIVPRRGTRESIQRVRAEAAGAQAILNAATATRTAADGLSWQPKTRCREAQKHPDTYKLPAAIPYTEHLAQAH